MTLPTRSPNDIGEITYEPYGEFYIPPYVPEADSPLDRKVLKSHFQALAHGRGSDIRVLTDSDDQFIVEFYTQTNQYTITASYGAGTVGRLLVRAESRKARAGENWHRGYDLIDAELTNQTWYDTMNAMLSFEMVRLHRGTKLSPVG